MKKCKIFKFGGASIKNADGVINLCNILHQYPNDNLIIVISAIGKTTNLLEQILHAYHNHTGELESLIDTLKNNHYTIARELAENDDDTIEAKLGAIFNQLEAQLTIAPAYNFDFDYDRIVSFGELLSSQLISTYMNMAAIPNHWLDARNVLFTDNNFREGRVDWVNSTEHIQKECIRLMESGCNRIITQGFLGATAEKLTTTLGREGSDYTAAIFAYILDAELVTIWKDVPGLLNADPAIFPDAVKLDQITYEEAIELAYYGASVIHPKTLKPLQNKTIPLYVKSFYYPEQTGTLITISGDGNSSASIIFKRNQILISIYPKDFSFIDVENLSFIFSILSQQKITINLLQNSALSFSICTDFEEKRINKAIDLLSEKFKIKYNNHTELITIRHYNEKVIEKVIGKRQILVEQRSRIMLQVVVNA